MNNKKVIVIGLDGADFDSLNGWISEGHLPNIKRIKETGSHGNLKSLFPASTGPVWTSFFTGKNPGKHGLFDFMQRETDSYNRIPADSSFIKSERIWDILTISNKKSIVVNVPMTYPAQELNGIMVTGIMTPRQSENYTYPKEFKNELEDIVKDYTFFPEEPFSKSNIDKYYNCLLESLKKRAKVIKYLLKNKEFDLFIGVFGVTDFIQHGLLFTMDESHPLYDEKFSRQHRVKILEIYKKVDEVIGEILELKDDDTYLMLMSDHGFGLVHYFFNVNNFLVKNGFIKFKKNLISQIKLLMFKLGFTVRNIYVLLQKIKLASLRHKVGGGQYRGVYKILKKIFLSFNDIDWPRTKAYSFSTYGQIYINLKGREKQGAVLEKDYEKTVGEIKQRLGRLKDPANPGQAFIKEIYRKEDLYKGEQLEGAADIIMRPRSLKTEPFAAFDFGSNKIFEKAFGTSGTHRGCGAIFYVLGPGIKNDHLIEGVRIIDLAPTILSLLGVPIPDDIDGKVLEEACQDKSGFSFIKEKKFSKPKESGLGKEVKTEEEVMDRLKSLGYI